MRSLPALQPHEFPLVDEATYLDTATQSPLSQRTHDALAHAVAQAQLPGTSRGLSGHAAEALARMRVAQLLDVAEDTLVFTPNTTHGMNLCAHGITWRPGDNVVLPAREFPALVRAWLGVRAAGVDVRLAPWSGAGPTAADVMAVTDGRTRVIACSAVAWDTGWSMNLAELGHRCRAAGILLVVDGIQAVRRAAGATGAGAGGAVVSRAQVVDGRIRLWRAVSGARGPRADPAALRRRAVVP